METAGYQLFDFIGDEPSLRPYGKGDGPLDIAGTWSLGRWMRKEWKGVFYKRGEFIFCKRLKKRLQQNFGQNCVSGLLKAQDQLLLNIFMLQHRALPETLLYAKGVQQDNPLYAHGCHGQKNSPKDLRPWQCKDESEREWGGRRMDKADVHVQRNIGQRSNTSGANQSSCKSHTKFISFYRTVDLQDMSETAAIKPHFIFVDEIVIE